MKTDRKEEMYSSIRQWEKSGLTQAAWIKEQGFTKSTFQKWLRRYRCEQEEENAPTSSCFIPIEIAGDGFCSELVVTYPNGVVITSSSPLSLEKLKALIHLY